MPAPKGNKYWEFRDKHGRDYKYNPDALWKEALNYFKWVEENPLWEAVTIQRGIKIKDEKGNETIEYFAKAPKMRAMTLTAFCLFADITIHTFENYEKIKDFLPVTTRIKEIIYTQKFEGAAATLLNPNIIARDLGLSEKTDNKNTNINYNTEELTKEQIKEIQKTLRDEYL